MEQWQLVEQDHKPKHDYEEKARARAEAGGAKALKNYQTKLAKDIKYVTATSINNILLNA
jgi:hypothetical protein